MKVSIRMKYRHAWLLVAAVVIFAILIAMTIALFCETGNPALIAASVFLGAVIAFALLFAFNYGIFINEKRLIAIEQGEIRILRYDDISYIVVKFTNVSVSMCVKMKSQREHVLVWSYLYLGANILLPSESKVKLCDKFVEDSIAKLSACPKVKIQNFYKPSGK